MNSYAALNDLLKTRNVSNAQRTLLGNIMSAESDGDATARNGYSTATGYFQFLESTFLKEMKEHGAEHGYGRYAQAISYNARGRYDVRDPQMRREILALRSDLRASTMMMLEFTEANRAGLRDALDGVEPDAGQLYLAHFAGLGGAVKVIEALQKQRPDTPIQDLLSDDAIKANSRIKFRGKPFARFTAADLNAWAAGKMDIDVPARIAYSQRTNHTADEEAAERRKRQAIVDDFGDEEQQRLSNMLGDKFLFGMAFVALLVELMGEIADRGQEQSVPQAPLLRKAEAPASPMLTLPASFAAAVTDAVPTTPITLSGTQVVGIGSPLPAMTLQRSTTDLLLA